MQKQFMVLHIIKSKLCRKKTKALQQSRHSPDDAAASLPLLFTKTSDFVSSKKVLILHSPKQ